MTPLVKPSNCTPTQGGIPPCPYPAGAKGVAQNHSPSALSSHALTGLTIYTWETMNIVRNK